ncbi:MAG: TlpA family protein disulfide reductase [Epulopiscium sp.]|nr:TlpA family protein disulfide reductase [Candidatus Epulonipiscium sp.]
MKKNGFIKKGFLLFVFIIGLLSLGACNNQNKKTGEKEADFSGVVQEEQREEKSGDTEKMEEEKIEAPDFTAVDGEGNQVSLSDLKGKVVFLNFWGSWCPPCVAEMPHIQSMYEKYTKDREDVAFLAINDQTQPREKPIAEVKQWLEEKGYTFPVAYDTDSSITQKYSIRAFPTTFMIDKEGYVYGYVPGGLTEEQMEEIIELTLDHSPQE